MYDAKRSGLDRCTGILVLSAFVLLISSCGNDRPAPAIIASAPAASAAVDPIAHYLTALEKGAAGIELDVQLTADNVLVTWSDRSLPSGTSCDGLVHSLSWAQIKGCETLQSNVDILRVDSFLLTILEHHPRLELILDCKLHSEGEWWLYLEAFTDALIEVDKNSVKEGSMSVECMDDEFLLLLQRKQPRIPLFLFSHDAEPAMWRAITSKYRGISIPHQYPTKKETERALGLGLEVTLEEKEPGEYLRIWDRKQPSRLKTSEPERHLK